MRSSQINGVIYSSSSSFCRPHATCHGRSVATAADRRRALGAVTGVSHGECPPPALIPAFCDRRLNPPPVAFAAACALCAGAPAVAPQPQWPTGSAARLPFTAQAEFGKRWLPRARLCRTKTMNSSNVSCFAALVGMPAPFSVGSWSRPSLSVVLWFSVVAAPIASGFAKSGQKFSEARSAEDCLQNNRLEQQCYALFMQTLLSSSGPVFQCLLLEHLRLPVQPLQPLRMVGASV